MYKTKRHAVKMTSRRFFLPRHPVYFFAHNSHPKIIIAPYITVDIDNFQKGRVFLPRALARVLNGVRFLRGVEEIARMNIPVRCRCRVIKLRYIEFSARFSRRSEIEFRFSHASNNAK